MDRGQILEYPAGPRTSISTCRFGWPGTTRQCLGRFHIRWLIVRKVVLGPMTEKLTLYESKSLKFYNKGT